MTEPQNAPEAPSTAPPTETPKAPKKSRPSRHRGSEPPRGKPFAKGVGGSAETRFGGPRSNASPGGKPKRYIEVIEGLQALTPEVKDRMMEIIRSGKPADAAPVIRLFWERAWGRAPAHIPSAFDVALTPEQIDRELERRLLTLALADTPDPNVLLTVMRERGLIKKGDGPGDEGKPTGVNLVPDGAGRPGHRLEDVDADGADDDA